MRAFLTVKIHGHLYRFYRVKRVDDDDNRGECDFEKKTIKVKRGMEKRAESETLLHECLHSIDTEMSERRIHHLSTNLYQIFKDNPKLLDIIFPR